MSHMFGNATSFDQSLDGWDVSSVTDMSHMFGNATSFDGDISGWDVSGVTRMGGMFDGAGTPDRDLGEWYIVLDGTAIDYADAPGIVGSISAQNPFLDGQNPVYGIGPGGDSGSFEIVDGSSLRLKEIPTKISYTVTITSTGEFGSANSRTFDIGISGLDNPPPPALAWIPDQTVPELSTLTFAANVTNGHLLAAPLTYGLDGGPRGASMDPATGEFEWTPTEIQDGGHAMTVTVSDRNGLTGSQDVVVVVREVNAAPVLAEIPDQTVDASSALAFEASATDGDLHPGVGTEVVAKNLRVPWSIDWTPDGTALFTERGGNLRMIQDGILAPGPLLSLDVSGGEGGLLGVAVDPDFGDNRYVYLYYSTVGTDHAFTNKVVRYQFANGTITEDAVLIDGIPGARYHDGGRIQFGPDGYLYVTTGDASSPDLAQDLGSLAGKILRIDRDGGVPTDNPFADSAVWSTGHRNSQGMDWDERGNMVATEHGPSGGQYGRAHDEINVIVPGANYGWPTIVGGRSADGMQAPILHTGTDTWAPSGAEFYYGDMIPGWAGKYFVAALRGAHLHMVDLDLPNGTVVSHEPLFQGEFGRLRDVQTGPDGYLYLLTSNRDGRGTPVPDDDRILRVVLSDDADKARPANALTYGLEGAPEGASIDPASGAFEWEPANGRPYGTVTFNVTVSDGRGGTDAQPVRVHVIREDETNSPPAADAGANQTVREGDTVTLSGVATDDDGDPLTYLWTHDSALLPIAISDDAAPSTTFTAPAVDGDTAVTFTLTVSDGANAAVTDQTTVTITDNAPPAADAGASQTVREGATVTLSGAATDDDGDSLTYSWTSDRPGLSISNGSTLAPSFVAPQVDADTAIVFTLSVSDGANAAVTDQTTVIITNNAPPAADAGASQTVQEGATVTLSGVATDDDGDSLTYLWTHDSALPIELAGNSTLSTTFTAPAVDSDTAVTFTLTVSDGTASTSDAVTITVQDAPEAPEAPDASDFVTTWETSAPNQSITIPARGTYDIDWGDGTSEDRVSGPQTHTYGSAGVYTIRISDGITWFWLANHADAGKLVSIDQWGDAQWHFMYQAFQGASNMRYNASDVPDLSYVTSTKYMFEGAAAFDGDISGWDVSNVGDMSYMFKGARAFDSDISAWDVSSATAMAGMFWNARAFDSDLSAWDVSGVTDMYAMFHRAHAFDSDLSAWDVSGATGMANMFSHARAFDSDLSAWDVSGVTTMHAMFAGTRAFDSDLSSWNVSRVADMADMFRNTKSFNGDISGWDISEDARLGSMMFYKAKAFEQNLGEWYVTLRDASIRPGDVPGVVGYVTTLNPHLDAQNPSYAIGAGGDSAHFEMDYDALVMKSVPEGDGPYTVNITSSGGYGTGNSRMLEVAVSDSAEPAPAGPRDITGVALASAAPGAIEVSWDAPAKAPDDYRVKWAKTGEDFLPWRNADGNAFPTAPGYDIAGLDEGEEYKVQVRARYQGSPNGGWSDVYTVTVTSAQ